jgi:TolB protein
MSRLFRFLLIMPFLLASLPALAQTPATQPTKRIYIIIDQPSSENKFPIAVPDLLYIKETNDKENLAVKIPDILKNDLKIAGYFKVLDKSSFLENPGPGLTAPEIDFKKWTAIEANALVKGGMYFDGKNLVLQMRLFDPFTGEMLTGKEYKVEKKNYRAAVHRFMDEIMLALTGERGVFSTKIVAACGKTGQKEIYIMDIDGENRIQVTKNGSINVSPAWSPDGTQIAYTSYAKYFPEIFVTSVGGKGKTKRVTYNNSMNITPAWAPDGSGLAISSSMSGDPEIYLIDLQGNKRAQLTRSFGIDLAPTWSPDSQNLIFASERAGRLHLFSMDRNGGNVRRLTYAGIYNDQPDWSPKGDKVVFASQEGREFDIFTMNVDGSLIQRLTSGAGSNESPSYSPDGRYIVYTSTRGFKSDVYIMLWEGSNPTRITNTGNCVNPDWSPWLN